MTLAKIPNTNMPLMRQDAENQADTIIARYAGWATSIMRVVED